ncbi:MAG TPA: gephyrin-like molybdotransferase Glp [Solirubrobacteraceae bacterium]
MARPLISVHDARELVLHTAKALETEPVGVASALGRVLAETVSATGDVPPFPCSAMDGYAISPGDAGRTLVVVGESRAGTPFSGRLGEGEAVRISTGAALPDDAAAVIPQEEVTVTNGRIETLAEVAAGAHVRNPGEDMDAGSPILRPGTVLSGPHIGAAVAAGAASLVVSRRPRVAIFTTGDELREPGEPLGPGEIHNSNGPMLEALATSSGAIAEPTQKLPDDRAATEEGLGAALDRADVVIVSGGVSVGPHDHVKPALEALGVQQIFWSVALQPGKPTWFGTRNGRLVFGLPGNPVSAAVTFSLFARPALFALQGATPPSHQPAEAVLAEPVARNPARTQAVRVRLEQRDGAVLAAPNGPQGSHIVTSLIGADALAMIPAGEGSLQAGSRVALEPLPG